MTEEQWIRCADPYQMLGALQDQEWGRKAQLLAVACCRRLWHHLRDPRAQRAVEVAEEHADGKASEEEYDAALAALDAALDEMPEDARWDEHNLDTNLLIASAAVLDDPFSSAINTIKAHQQAGNGFVVVELIRCIFGNPFRPAGDETVWLTWSGGTVPKLAQGIYDERAFDRLPILADALEEAGCTNTAILDHCRGPGPHVRGCWVVDLLLAKK